MRIFIAIKLNNYIKSYLKGVADSLEPYFLKARFTHYDNYHITLKFIGESNRMQFNKVVTAVKSAASESYSFTLETMGPGSFRRKNKHIVYCDVKNSDKLQRLYDVIIKNLKKVETDIGNSSFSPHITLAREAVLIDSFPKINIKSTEIEVDSICVMESTRVDGKLTYIPRYTAKLKELAQ